MARDTDTRAVTLVDIPLIRRLTDRATVLDSEIEFTRDAVDGAILSSLLPQRSLYTLVARSDKQQVIGQFRMQNQHAHIIYIAPSLDENMDDTVWLHILDAMAREAGKHNAHALIAEVNEDSSLFETMRTAGFAVYARQQIWRRVPEDHIAVEPDVELKPETENDATSIQSLIINTVPPLTQQICSPPGAMDGWIYRKNERIEAYIAVSEGKRGIYIMPYLHPDISREVPAVLEAAIRQMQNAHRRPVYVCVRRHQDWINGALEAMRFEQGPRQAVMVKHITAGVRHATFKPVRDGVPAVGGPLKPPTNGFRCHNEIAHARVMD